MGIKLVNAMAVLKPPVEIKCSMCLLSFSEQRCDLSHMCFWKWVLLWCHWHSCVRWTVSELLWGTKIWSAGTSTSYPPSHTNTSTKALVIIFLLLQQFNYSSLEQLINYLHFSIQITRFLILLIYFKVLIS